MDLTPSTRDQLLLAATHVFASQGFEGASTRRIAARAGANQGLITHYFGSKLALWQLVMADCFSGLDAALADEPRCLNARDELRRLALAFVLFSARNPELHRLILHASTSDGPRLDWLVTTQVRPRLEPIMSLLGQEGEVDSAVHLLFAVLGAGTHIFAIAPLVQKVSGRDPTEEVAAEAYAAFLVERMLGEP